MMSINISSINMLRFFMKLKNSVTAKLVGATASAIFVILLITTYILVSKVSENTSERLDSDIEKSIELYASDIESYFKTHITRAEVIFRNTWLIDWFEQHRDRGQNLDTPEYKRMMKVFSREMKGREDIASVFFGSKYTGEYFDQGGVSGLTGYNVLTRPWWQEVRDTNAWNVSGVTYEPQIESFYVAINFPIVNFSNEFIGAGGVDLYLQAIDEIVSKINFDGVGQAFLIDNNGDMIVFNSEKLADVNIAERKTTNIKLANLETNNQHDGFSDLSKQMLSKAKGTAKVVWNNEQYHVQYRDVVVEKLNLKWKLAVMVPQDYVDAPVNEAIISAILVSSGILLITLLVLWFSTAKLLQPLLSVKQALVEIAGGAGDLSQRIKIKSDDEVGQLSDAFNRFIEQIQNIVSRVQQTSEELRDTTVKVAKVSEITVSKTSDAEQELHLATDTVSSMAENAHTIKERISTARETAHIASQTSQKGQDVLASSMDGLVKLNANFDSAVHTIEELRASSQSIGEVMDVIKNIADQTNLLALNAAIESARAGEHGRGFAVVADEVRQLAQRTQESTTSIQQNIEDLQAKAHAAEDSMSNTREQVNQYMDNSKTVHTQLTEIASVVETNRDDMQEIVNITSEQDNVAQNIREMMQHVNQLGTDTSDEAQSLMKISTALENKTDRLKDLVGRFKI